MSKSSTSTHMSKHGPLSVNVNDEIRAALKGLANSSDMSMSEYLREVATYAAENKITFVKRAFASLNGKPVTSHR